jgi:hypothetical protein
MATEQQHNWSRHAMLILTILGVGVGIYVTIHDNSQDNIRQDKEIIANRTDIKANERRIDKTEINQVDLQKTNEAINSTLLRMESSQTAFHNEMKAERKEDRAAQKIVSDKVINIEARVEHITKE